jgi:glutamine amidotransferase PdxT
MITIIDYGVGNIKAFYNIFKKLSVDVKIAQKPSDLFESSKLILPGVGHFDYAMKCFNDSGMRTVVDELVQGKKIPVLGICVGMQMMANSSEEGNMSGLGWIDARRSVSRINGNAILRNRNNLTENILSRCKRRMRQVSLLRTCKYAKGNSRERNRCYAKNNKFVFGNAHRL